MNLISQVSTVNSLINFVTGEQMHVALTAIGDNHFRTAERVLSNLPKVRDQAAQLRIVISHLEGAHTAYQNQWYPLKSEKNFQEAFIQVFRPLSCLTACKKDIYTCCLLAACYAYLKEEELVHLYIEHAEVAQQGFNKWRKKTLDRNDLDSVGGFRDSVGRFWVFTDTPAFFQLRKVPEVSLPDYKNNLLRILPELCNR